MAKKIRGPLFSAAPCTTQHAITKTITVLVSVCSVTNTNFHQPLATNNLSDQYKHYCLPLKTNFFSSQSDFTLASANRYSTLDRKIFFK